MSGPTPTVDAFLAAEKADSNAWWRLESGHHLNLFEQAVEERDEARAAAVRVATSFVMDLNHQHAPCPKCLDARAVITKYSGDTP